MNDVYYNMYIDHGTLNTPRFYCMLRSEVHFREVSMQEYINAHIEEVAYSFRKIIKIHCK